MSLTTYCVESLTDVRPELEKLLPLHWQEIARDRSDPRFGLKPDWETYHALEREGQFFFLACRVDGKLVGYLIGFVRRQLHYVKSLAFTADIYFLLPEYRKGRIGVELFRQAETALRRRGVDKIYLGSKARADLDRSKLFEHLGYEKIEYIFAKVISSD
jgi:GNAT superfamily N-acetyltransferase